MFPKPSQLLLVETQSLTDFGAYVKILDYPHTKGMIPIQELSERRKKVLMTRVGKVEVVSVLSIDEQKGFIDLSKKNISLEDVQRVVSESRKQGSHRAIVDVICHRYNEVDTIKEAMLEGLSVAPDVHIQYDRHTYDISSGDELTTRRACDAIIQRIEELGGNAR